MIKIKARRLLNYDIELLLNKLNGDFILIFDDGQEIQTNERQTIISVFTWEFFKRYPDTPLLKKHHISSTVKNKCTPSKAYNTLLQAAMMDVMLYYKHQYSNVREFAAELSRLAYKITNDIYNLLSHHSEEHITTLDIVDFLELNDDPLLNKTILEMPSSQDGIDVAMKVGQDLLYARNDYDNNAVVKAVRRGITREAQLLQMLVTRGFTTDINSHIFRRPIRASYIRGIRLLSESMIESRSAAKSLANAEKPLQDSEYFSRKQQLVGMTLTTLEPGDCGSTNYIKWKVRDASYENGVKMLDCDLNTIYGKYYLDETTGKLAVVKKTDRHLIGKTILIRDAVAGCNSRNPYGICEVCFGTASSALTPHANLGHATIVDMTSKIGQLILSTKHHDGTSKLEPVVLKGLEKTYLTVNSAGTAFSLSSSIKNKRVNLHISQSDFEGMADVINGMDVINMSPFRVSSFQHVTIEVFTRSSSELIPLDVSSHSRSSSLSPQMLRFIKEKYDSGAQYGIEVNTATGENKYVISMDGWDYSQPVFVLPMSHFNMSDHQGEIAKILESTASELYKRSNAIDPVAMLIELHDLVNHRLTVHLSILSTSLLASMVVNATEGLYDIPKAFTNRGVGVMRNLLTSRSLAAMMAFQNHRIVFLSPSSFMVTDRPNHPFDAVVMPSILNNPMIRRQYHQ